MWHKVRRANRVGQVKILKPRGDWRSKSGGRIKLLFSFSSKIRNQFFSYNNREAAKLLRDIRGFRSYVVKDLRCGGIGGKEFHRLRNELVFVIAGRVRWDLEDLHGRKKIVLLKELEGIWIPPFILHTYRVLKPNTILMSIASTRYHSRASDTYPRSRFSKLR